MEYGKPIECDLGISRECPEKCDDNYQRFVGYEQYNECIRKLFAPKTIDKLSRKITQLLQGVDPKGRPIIVPNRRICTVLSSVYNGYRPPTGDIYSRYIVPNNEQTDMVQSILDQTVEIITENVRNNLGIEENNSKLSAWVQVYGDFNPHGLRRYSPIKLKRRRATRMQFNMNY